MPKFYQVFSVLVLVLLGAVFVLRMDKHKITAEDYSVWARTSGQKVGVSTVDHGPRPPSGHHCKVYDLSQPINEQYKCVKTRNIQPQTIICVYDVDKDWAISKKIVKEGHYQGKTVEQEANLLKRYPDAGFIDVGANIGMHTLTIAQMGRQVVSVEPNIESVRRLQRSAQLSGTTKYITLVNNGISDERTTAGMSLLQKDNQGAAGVFLDECPSPCIQNITTILLDDLLEVTTFKTAIMKIDIEGFEDKAFSHADVLFKTVDIPYVVMEWFMVKKKDKSILFKTIDWFVSNGYQPYDGINKKAKLVREKCKSWPFDVVWVKE